MSRRNIKSVNNIDDVEYLDTVEQNEIIQKLKDESTKQTEWFRYIFAIMFGFVGSLMIFCLFHFIIYPFELNHEARFHYIIPVPGMMLFYICSSMTCFGSSLICLKGSKEVGQGLIFLQAVAILNSLFWFYTFYEYEVTSITMYWLPLINMSILTISLYLDKDFNKLVSEIEHLEENVYNYKKI